MSLPPRALLIYRERLRTSPTVIEALGLSRLHKVLPDFAVGVRHEFIKIQKDPQSESKVPTEFLIFLNDIYMSINSEYPCRPRLTSQTPTMISP